MSDTASGTTVAPGWAVPGATFQACDGEVSDDVLALGAAVDEALRVVPSALEPRAAVSRAEGLLRVQERVSALALAAVADVEARDLWRLRAAGSTRTWLRTLPSGDRGQLALARLLERFPVLLAALGAGEVSVRTAGVVARELARVPAHVDLEQLQGVLVDGLGDLLGVWAGAACLEPTAAQETEFETRRERLASAVRSGLAETWGDAAGQLEPAFVLAAEVLAPAELEAGLRVLVDALQPEADLDAAAEQEHRSRGLVLRKLAGGGWSLRAHLTDETGQLLFEALAVREDTHPLQKARTTRERATEPDGAGDSSVEDVFDGSSDDDSTGSDDDSTGSDETDWGTCGPGVPLTADGTAAEGTPLPSAGQRAHDALARLLTDLAAVAPGSGVPVPGRLTLIGTLAALEGRPGAPPGRLVTSRGDVPLTPSQLRSHACRTLLSVVVTDAFGRPLAASGEHRHATARERRAMAAAWGSTCAVNGCTLPGEVPHHGEPYWKSGETVLKDLVPLCRHHHHDVHDGHSTLRLRDGRLLDEWGWVAPRA